MMNEKETLLTEEGLRKLEAELDELKTVHRKEVNDRIRQAKEFGDISENAEYEYAKQEQAFVEGRILKLEVMIRSARIIEESEGGGDEVHLGSTVKTKNRSSALLPATRLWDPRKAIRSTRRSRMNLPSAKHLSAPSPARSSTSTRPAAKSNSRSCPSGAIGRPALKRRQNEPGARARRNRSRTHQGPAREA